MAPRFSKNRLVDAAKRGDVGGLRAELARKPVDDYRSFQRALDAAFEAAAKAGEATATAYLIDQGADATMVNWSEGQKGGPEIVALVLERCRDVFPDDADTLAWAAELGLMEFIRQIKARGEVDFAGPAGSRALLSAADRSQTETLPLLAELGATPHFLGPIEHAAVFHAYDWPMEFFDPPQSQ